MQKSELGPTESRAPEKLNDSEAKKRAFKYLPYTIYYCYLFATYTCAL